MLYKVTHCPGILSNVHTYLHSCECSFNEEGRAKSVISVFFGLLHFVHWFCLNPLNPIVHF